MYKYVFIIGTGRTGTVFLESFFNENIAGCLAVQEPSHRIKILGNAYLSGKVNARFMHSYLTRFKNKANHKLDKHESSVWMQPDAWLIGFTEFLEEVFPACYIVHLVRNPLEYIPSILNRYYKENIKGFLRDVIPFWKLKGYRAGNYTKSVWNRLSPEEKMAWQWVKYNEHIQAHKLKFSNYILLRYEDVYDKDFSGLQQMIDFCEIDYKIDPSAFSTLKKRKNLADKKFPSYENWDDNKKMQVLDICSKLMEEYRYKV